MVRRDLENLRLFNQVCKMPTSRLTRKIFEFNSKSKGSSWTNNLRKICQAVGETDAVARMCPVNLSTAEVKLLEMYQDVWRHSVKDKVKLELYREIKPNFGPEPHLTAYLSKNKRSLISRLRTGSLNLEVESGRFTGQKREDRICRLCHTDIETELHFLFECSALVAPGSALYLKISELTTISTNVEKLKTLVKMPYTFGNYIERLWNERSIAMGSV